MRTLIPVLLLAALGSAARAEIYECTEPDGSKRFTNIKSEARGCKLLDIGPFNTVPFPKPQAKPAPTPSNFPKVDPRTQRERDVDRRRILEQELANEQKLLEQAQKELAAQEAIRLGSERNYQRVLDRLEPYQRKVKQHEDNIANIRKEIANLK
jgi:hypothetical protein